jgi:integrase
VGRHWARVHEGGWRGLAPRGDHALLSAGGEAFEAPRIRLHDLRHKHATLALRAGIPPKVVSERLGHATIAITLDTYSHAIPAMQEEAAVLIADLISAAK